MLVDDWQDDGDEGMKKPQKDPIAEFLLLRIREGMDRLSVHERWSLPFDTIQVRMAALFGPARAAEESQRYAAQIVLYLMAMLAGTFLLCLVSGTAMLPAGLVLMLVYVLYSFKSLDNRVKQRRRLIVLELPELLNKLILLLNAGETLHQAIHRCVSSGEEEGHPLRKEWARLSRSLTDSKPFVLAMEEFTRSCSVLEVSMFSTSVLMNFRRGGSDFAASLQELSHTLWERRKAEAKIIGEEAASKLVFPMVLLFCTVMIIVAAPAILIMN
jgi:tight adherence protein C